MTNELVIATKNEGKAREFRELLAPKGITIKTLADFPEIPQVAETGQTFEENATLKATAVAQLTSLPVLADDSGLVVDALDGQPGIYSARYAGNHDDRRNMAKLLRKLDGVPKDQRTAHFQTTLVLVKPTGKKMVTNGYVKGLILTEPRGENGFGYDPVFFVPAYHQTLAEMTEKQKNAISHRGHAAQQMLENFDEWWDQA
ncbi:XTP/dITP diphosphatase [Levilactobacillus bambusae]|uniref:dITP/XTP pyrophosphatase n=1 Tax=Levilactobacillus bambusae TaxID=2024736 RepID=A0A2V1MZK8_9LACO|nr:XTP/dITP diphosphatase [Levilactobacillus bambusae]PWF99594.1 non-canonical purine NTP pyrophosphatase [Levilactobacillus bambusae]